MKINILRSLRRCLDPKPPTWKDWMWDRWDDVEYYIISPVRDLVRDLRMGVSNLAAWLPIIWRDRDWDFCFLLIVMEFKLKRMADSLEEGDRHLGVEKSVKDIRTCIFLVKRLVDDDYCIKKSKVFSSQFYRSRYKSFGDSDIAELTRIMRRGLRSWWD